MSAEYYNPNLHTPLTLAEQLAQLPQHLVVAGSIGRCALMGKLKPLEKPDGRVTDVDVIDLTGAQRAVRVPSSLLFPVDALLTNMVRPIDGHNWGLFIFGSPEPFAVIDEEFCAPVTLAVPWQPERSITVVPPALQLEIIDLKAPYKKNKSHIADYTEFVGDDTLPSEVRKIFTDFREVNWEIEKKTHQGQSLSKTGRLYKRASREYHDRCPEPLQRTIESHLGDTIRTVRRKLIP